MAGNSTGQRLEQACESAGRHLVAIYLDLLCRHRDYLSREVLSLIAQFGSAAGGADSESRYRTASSALRAAGAITMYLHVTDPGRYEKHLTPVIRSCRVALRSLRAIRRRPGADEDPEAPAGAVCR